jgi:hypothetical protein
MNGFLHICGNGLSPLRGLFHPGTQPTAHAVGYSLTALRACASARKRYEFDDAAPLIQPNQHSLTNRQTRGFARCLPNEPLCWPLPKAAEQRQRVAQGVSLGSNIERSKPRQGRQWPTISEKLSIAALRLLPHLRDDPRLAPWATF